jgi:protein gp37
MTGKTTIEWSDQPGYVGAVWNPTTGCTRVSAGCDNCYAFALHDKRYVTNRTRAIAFGYSGIEAAADARENHAELPWPKQYDLPFSRVQLLPERLDAPLRTRRPTCYFVDSMSDLFHEDVPDAFIADVWDVMEKATQHRFLILTKRPDRMGRWVRERHYPGSIMYPEAPAPNIWLGTSVEDQASADKRIPELLATPAAVRFLSCEPLLGNIGTQDCGQHPEKNLLRGIDWVIVGGESGPRARPMDLAWARSLVESSRAAGVDVFVKQLGSNPVGLDRDCDVCSMGLKAPRRDHGLDCMGPLRESHGRDMAEWPEDLRIREFPE